MTTVNERYERVEWLLQARAAWGGRAFRRWFYPNNPETFELSPDLFTTITAKLDLFPEKSTEEIATEIYREKGG